MCYGITDYYINISWRFSGWVNHNFVWVFLVFRLFCDLPLNYFWKHPKNVTKFEEKNIFCKKIQWKCPKSHFIINQVKNQHKKLLPSLLIKTARKNMAIFWLICLHNFPHKILSLKLTRSIKKPRKKKSNGQKEKKIDRNH